MRGRRFGLAITTAVIAGIVASTTAATATGGGTERTEAVIARLDTTYQNAVKHNDASTMRRILADDFVLVTGKGHTFTKADLLNEATTKECVYEQQDEVAGTQTVRVYDDHTAVVTALLWIKATCTDGSASDFKLWFSDTYARRHGSWGYVFGQSAQPL
jgi:ketosteroid isomerase-like protein